MDKKSMRQQMLERRNQLTKETVTLLSEKIATCVTASGLYKTFPIICIYQAFRNEVSCKQIMEHAFSEGKHVFVPMTDMEQRTMEFYRITENTKWNKGAYGILEPVITDCLEPLRKSALILMPGLVFDRNKHRIGYGSGYYDKYLATHTKHTTAALCYSFQITDEDLPFEQHDKLPDYIFTENGSF